MQTLLWILQWLAIYFACGVAVSTFHEFVLMDQEVRRGQAADFRRDVFVFVLLAWPLIAVDMVLALVLLIAKGLAWLIVGGGR